MPIAGDGGGGIDKNKKDKKDKKKSKIPLYNPLITDGRFLYAVIPEKPLKKEDEEKKYITNKDKGDNDDDEEEEITIKFGTL